MPALCTEPASCLPVLASEFVSLLPAEALPRLLSHKGQCLITCRSSKLFSAHYVLNSQAREQVTCPPPFLPFC